MTSEPAPTKPMTADDPTVAGVSPGTSVRRAREQAKLSVNELASQTKLTRNTIEALERDDFAVLSQAVYARGYYRKCAKVLALPEDDLIAAYEKLAAPEMPLTPIGKLLLSSNESETRAGLRRRGGSGGRWMTIALVVIIAAAAVFGYLMNDPQESSWLQKSVGSVAIVDNGPASAPAASAIDPATVATPAAAGSDADTTEAANDAKPVTEGASAPASPVGLTPATAAPVIAVAAAPETNTSSAVGVATGPAPAGALDIDFTAASWIRVEDADGKLLLSGLMPAGQHQRVLGRTPYSMLVGNALGLRVQFDGKAVDLTPFTRPNSTARIRIP
jgi:cytoskeleton protein RodZ